MKPRLLFLAGICLLLYGWYALTTDQIPGHSSRPNGRRSRGHYMEQASLYKSVRDSLNEHAIGFSGPSIW